MGSRMKAFETFLRGVTCAATLVGFGSVANAATTTLYSDFGPGQSYFLYGAWAFGSADGATPESFVPTTSGFVNAIDVAITSDGPGQNATFSLWTNDDGELGTELGSWVVSGYSSSSTGSIVAITGVSGIELTAGQTYYLQATSANLRGWFWNNQGVVDLSGLDAGTTAAAFDILGSAVPEPVTWAMMILGLTVIGVTLRRRRESVAIAA